MTRNNLVKGMLLTVAFLGLSTAAQANGGSYVDTYDTVHPTTEYMSGIYVGVQGGYAMHHWDDLDGLKDLDSNFRTSASNGQFGVRPFIGYDFNEFFAIEGGWTHLSGYDVKTRNGDGTVILFKDSPSAYAFDVNAKFKIPLDNGFGIYTKVGMVYLNVSDAPKTNLAANGDFASISKDDRSNINVMFAAGVSYCFTPNFVADLSWTHFRGDSEMGNSFIPDVDFFALGMAYKFAV